MRTLSLAGLLGILALLSIGFTPAHAADKAKDLIVGKWEINKENQKGTIEFGKDNTLKARIKADDNDINITGTYKFLDDDTIEVEMTIMGGSRKHKLKVTVTKDELKTEDPDNGKKDTLKRVK